MGLGMRRKNGSLRGGVGREKRGPKSVLKLLILC